ncbi:hypothetical protein AB0H83_19305 [Dactylosporangium sp. NPDC050688]|uniref:hypothetical protein n=1 Tax=Dactylosporangium sp. NPDC050688 TaxID=3157217 RepID=UPI0034044F7A
MTVDIAAETPEADAEETFEPAGDAADGPSIIYTAYFTAAEELVEHIRAADVLNLGFRVESYLVAPEEGSDTPQIEFEFTLLSELPER